MVIGTEPLQMTLDLDPGLTERYSSVKECMAAGVYRLGLKKVAGKLYQYPGSLM